MLAIKKVPTAAQRAGISSTDLLITPCSLKVKKLLFWNFPSPRTDLEDGNRYDRCRLKDRHRDYSRWGSTAVTLQSSKSLPPHLVVGIIIIKGVDHSDFFWL